MIGASLVPDHQVVTPPLPADLHVWIFHGAAQQRGQRVRFVVVKTCNPVDVRAAEEQRAPAGGRVHAHDGLTPPGELGLDLLVDPLTELHDDLVSHVVAWRHVPHQRCQLLLQQR